MKSRSRFRKYAPGTVLIVLGLITFGWQYVLPSLQQPVWMVNSPANGLTVDGDSDHVLKFAFFNPHLSPVDMYPAVTSCTASGEPFEHVVLKPLRITWIDVPLQLANKPLGSHQSLVTIKGFNGDKFFKIIQPVDFTVYRRQAKSAAPSTGS